MTIDRERPDVLGAESLSAKHSAVDVDGNLRLPHIAGVRFRPTRPVPHEDGHVTEVARASWGEIASPIVQVHITTTLAGRVRAWGLHPRGTDRLFVVSGLVKLVVFDGRRDSPTLGRWNEFVASDRNPGLLIVPPNLYHGWKNIGNDLAVIINMPDRMYDYEEPDALDLPWDSRAARDLIPYAW
ncbi:MAG TPA: dTDP-4-dehydrorhamnose 3,5-epimerase family protein [Casimicrobiaceae bacterium]